MSIRDHYFPPPDPAAGWVRRTGQLHCLLDDPSFADLRLGDPVESISRFGAPENSRPTRDGVYEYYSQGFDLDATEGKVGGFSFMWSAQNPAKSFQGTFSWNGRPVNLGPSVREADILSTFGKPYWIDDEIGGLAKIFFYEYRGGALEWMVEFERGGLSLFSIVSPPVLSDPEVRADYKVTRPWPPR
jgi:hypothetical protein